MAGISINNLSSAIADELAKYNKEVTQEVKQIITDEANQLAENISNDSPKRNKKIKNRVLNRYSKGWKAEKQYEDGLNVSYVIHNKTDWQLTHLLQNGFATRDGGRVEGTDHIAKNEEVMIKSVEERIEKAVSAK
jgi:hypothetical protein